MFWALLFQNQEFGKRPYQPVRTLCQTSRNIEVPTWYNFLLHSTKKPSDLFKQATHTHFLHHGFNRQPDTSNWISLNKQVPNFKLYKNGFPQHIYINFSNKLATCNQRLFPSKMVEFIDAHTNQMMRFFFKQHAENNTFSNFCQQRHGHNRIKQLPDFQISQPKPIHRHKFHLVCSQYNQIFSTIGRLKDPQFQRNPSRQYNASLLFNTESNHWFKTPKCPPFLLQQPFHSLINPFTRILKTFSLIQRYF